MHKRTTDRIEALVKRLERCKERMADLDDRTESGSITEADRARESQAIFDELAVLLAETTALRTEEEAYSGKEPIGWFGPEEDCAPVENDGCDPEDYLQDAEDKLLETVSYYARIESTTQTAINLVQKTQTAWGSTSCGKSAPETRIYPVEIELCYHKVVGIRARSEEEALEAAAHYGTAELEPDDSWRIEGDDPEIASDEYVDENTKILEA